MAMRTEPMECMGAMRDMRDMGLMDTQPTPTRMDLTPSPTFLCWKGSPASPPTSTSCPTPPRCRLATSTAQLLEPTAREHFPLAPCPLWLRSTCLGICYCGIACLPAVRRLYRICICSHSSCLAAEASLCRHAQQQAQSQHLIPPVCSCNGCKCRVPQPGVTASGIPLFVANDSTASQVQMPWLLETARPLLMHAQNQGSGAAGACQAAAQCSELLFEASTGCHTS